jgi:beta-galactosidase
MAQAPRFSGVLFGAAYYPEYQDTDTVDRDLDLMKAAGFTTIRVGESVWSTWEPREGEFDLEWLAPTLDKAHDRGIGVILGTPTYAIPPWLQRAHPDMAIELADGSRIGWGARQEMDQSDPTYRRYAERIIRTVVGRYASHPAIVGFQVDNEPGLYLVHNDATFGRFVDWLRERYESVDELNRAWGLTYWSHRLSDWAELWKPRGNTLPQYDLEWRRFQSTLATDLISWQAGIVREYSRDDQFITTCISYSRPQISDDELSASLDVVAGNPYYRMQDGLDKGADDAAPEKWWSVGVPALYQWADRAWSSAQAPFLVTETNAQSIGSSWQNHPPFPGQLRQAAFALLSRGARMVEYWHWHTLRHGPETYWGGVLPHSQEPGRIYGEVAELGRALGAIGGALDDYRPDADVLMVHSSDTDWSYAFFPPLGFADGSPNSASYSMIFDAYYRGLFEAGAQVRVQHARQVINHTPEELLEQFPVIVVPTLYVADDHVLDLLVAYAEAGGHLVVGVRTGYADELGRPRAERAPGSIGRAAGIWYDEYTNIATPWPVTSASGAESWIEAGAAGLAWVDVLHVEDAEILAEYSANELGAVAAITTKATGAGRVTYVGTVPNAELARSLARRCVAESAHTAWSAPMSVSVATGSSGAERLTFVSNWSSAPSVITAPNGVVDLVSNEEFDAGAQLTLGARDSRVFRHS